MKALLLPTSGHASDSRVGSLSLNALFVRHRLSPRCQHAHVGAQQQATAFEFLWGFLIARWSVAKVTFVTRERENVSMNVDMLRDACA